MQRRNPCSTDEPGATISSGADICRPPKNFIKHFLKSIELRQLLEEESSNHQTSTVTRTRIQGAAIGMG